MDLDPEDECVSEGTRFLMYKSQSQIPDDRKKIRDKYQELIDDAKREKENTNFNVDNIVQNMSEADELFKEVCRPQEAIYDAKLVGIHSEITKKRAHEIQVGSPFNPAAFLRKLAFELTGEYSDSDVMNLNEEAWLKLGNMTFQKFNMTPKLNFIQGTFVEPVESIRQQRRIKEKEPKTKTVQPKVVVASQRKNADQTTEEIRRIKKILVNKCKRNSGAPVCYFSFTVDPNSFSRTIENMFHMAFLIKEREVYLSMDRNNLPVIEPLISGQSTAAECEATQSVLTMSVDKWKQLIEVFGITRPSIPPPD